MKRSLINKIISLTLIVALYFSMSISALADLDSDLEENQDAISEEAPSEDSITDSDDIEEEIIEAIDEAIDELVEDPEDDSEEEEDTDDIEDENLEEEESEDEELDEELEEELEEEDTECEEHEYKYICNHDGTHIVSCFNCDLEEYTETCEYDEDGYCIYCGYKRLPDPVLVYEDEEIIVNVYGAVPENADLKVTPIKKDNEETAEAYEAVEAKLLNETDAKEYDNYGFLAYDICFVNIESGEEVEPDGDVTVTMEYKQAALPIDSFNKQAVEKLDVSVIHINEVEDCLENLSDANKANLELDDGDALTKAEFTSDTFSTYIIQYKANSSKTIKIVFNNLDKNDNNLTQISTTDIIHQVESNSEEAISTFADTIDGYRFLKAQYTYISGGEQVTSEITKLYYYRNGNAYYLKLFNGGTQVGSNILVDPNTFITIDMIYERALSLSITKKATGPAAADNETEYEFILTNSEGLAITDKSYKVGNDNFSTGTDGKILLKTGQTADFTTLPAGEYKITEAGITGEAYELSDFITKVYVDSTLAITYPEATTTAREFAITIENNKHTDVIFKNFYTAENTVSQQEEEISKFITYNPADDDYKVALKVKGPSHEVEDVLFDQEETSTIETTNVDIVLVIDKSGSMERNSRMIHVKQACDLLSQVFVTKKHVDAQWKIVYFDTTASLSTNNWITSQQLYNKVSTTTGGATNYEAALNVAKAQLSTGRDDAKKVVIFLTDGEPTKYNHGNGTAGAGSAFDQTAYWRAMAVAKTITCDAFYSIGVDFGNSTYKVETKDANNHVIRTDYFTARQILENVTEEVNATTKSVSTVKSSEVVSLFSSLAGKITTDIVDGQTSSTTTYLATNATVTDPLSTYVDIEPNKIFYISVQDDSVELQDAGRGKWYNGYIDENGQMSEMAKYEIYEESGTVTITASYDAQSKTMVMNFPSNYQLPASYSYSIVFFVIPSEAAYDEYIETGYNATGDENTDNITLDESQWTSAGKPGFRSNGNAKFTYTYKGEDKSNPFPHPVIQVHFKNVWEIYKIDKEGATLSGAEFKLKEANVDDSQATYYTGISSEEQDINGLVIWNDTVLPGAYVLTEEKAPEGYKVSPEKWVVTISDENVPTVRMFKNAEDTEGEDYTVEVVRVKNIITYKFYYENELVTTSLPYTGGSGTRSFKMLGTLMISVAAVSYFLYRRERMQRK